MNKSKFVTINKFLWQKMIRFDSENRISHFQGEIISRDGEKLIVSASQHVKDSGNSLVWRTFDNREII